MPRIDIGAPEILLVFYWPAQILICASNSRLPRQAGQVPGLTSRSGPEFETAALAPRRLDLDAVSGGAGGADGVLELMFDVAAAQAELARQ